VRGDATPEEVAALVAVVQASAASAVPDERAPGEWGSPRRAARAPLAASRDGWRVSGLPGSGPHGL